MNLSSANGAFPNLPPPTARAHRRWSAPELNVQAISTIRSQLRGTRLMEHDPPPGSGTSGRALQSHGPPLTRGGCDILSHGSTDAVRSSISSDYLSSGASRHSANQIGENGAPTSPSERRPPLRRMAYHDDYFSHHQVNADGRDTPPYSGLEPEIGHSRTLAIEKARLKIFKTLTRKDDRNAPKTAAINVAAVQRFVIAGLQNDIIERVANIYTDSGDFEFMMRDLNWVISDYCNAVRDFEYMRQHALDHGKGYQSDMFYLESTSHLVRLAMEEWKLVPDHLLPKGPLPVALDQEDPRLPGYSRTNANRAADSAQFVARLSMASAGGMFVIVPIIVMANVPGKTASLVTTVVAMLAFAIGVTYKTELKADQVLAATAAYAAVLVVFVGTSLTDQS